MSKKRTPGKRPELILLRTPRVEEKKSVVPIRLIRSRNFWNSCPLKLDLMPDSPCALGRESSQLKSNTPPSCEWWINSEEHNFCFWRWVQDISLPDGRMDPLLQNEIAKLMNCSSTKIHFILKEAFENLKNSDYIDVLKDYATTDAPATYGSGMNVEASIPEPSSDE